MIEHAICFVTGWWQTLSSAIPTERDECNDGLHLPGAINGVGDKWLNSMRELSAGRLEDVCDRQEGMIVLVVQYKLTGSFNKLRRYRYGMLLRALEGHGRAHGYHTILSSPEGQLVIALVIGIMNVLMNVMLF